MTGKPPLLPDLSTLPDVAEIAQITTWLAEAGLASMDLSNAAGARLRLTVAPSPVTPPPAAPAPAETITATAPYFGHLALRHPLRAEPFAPLGATVRKGDTIALLTLDTLQVPVTAPADGIVAEILGQEGALVGYGAAILSIRP
ncbi:acetyl-CoA carboxylase biotin carboxyl carrier protein subunit [Gluconacetobacter takamatsuzukensis]|uniref:Acetyl-CoA carboxylase biotin carboxyl carrier protein subunit n=1 Tax=Gluconacetobacter takamatsuzukensis TaxID=1286190 RepID=A0A7W4PRF4_9PROT|nr:acetyl-CoA carboxylase biotin carboxyl carrier protein subunit [Gluconacetobacter takamatsuzukensis]MBB2205434.1 acetyl-CoA carboxylase biotin carboxyl carrier protein subunit [Gluconacetobacter takamatsuzukensis]